jgi:Bifunctional DNA primase/polymerase, N-terminal
MTTAADYARAYAARGWRVFPVFGKVPPAGFSYPTLATRAADAIGRWWNGEYRDCGVAVAPDTGLVVVDLDPAHGGIDAWRELNGPASECTSRTPSGGLHHYFSVDVHVGCPTHLARRGVDIKGVGGYVVEPPAAGRAWLAFGQPSDMAPNDVRRLLKPVEHATPPVAPVDVADAHTNSYGRKGHRGNLAELRTAHKGSRGVALNLAAYKDGRLVGGGNLRWDEAYKELVYVAVHTLGMSEARANATVKRGLTAGVANPRFKET